MKFRHLFFLISLLVLPLTTQAQSLDQFEMLPEDCFAGELYDPVEKVCYIECDSEEECLAKEQEIFGELEDFDYDGDIGQQEDVVVMSYDVVDAELRNPTKEDIPADLIDFQNERIRHSELWQYFLLIAPAEYVTDHVSRYEVFTDGRDGNLAYVSIDPNNAQKWVVGIDVQDAYLENGEIDSKELPYTLIHEFAHILTLESDQVPPDVELLSVQDDEEKYTELLLEKSADCPNYYPGEGCSKNASYINQFFRRYWQDKIEERRGIDFIEDDDAYYRALDSFYQKYISEFVTDYAATNPGEDIAESFAKFVLTDAPVGSTIKEQKILFFYAYDELVFLRNTIRRRLSDPQAVFGEVDPVQDQPVSTPFTAPTSVIGRILLQVEKAGEAWYVNPLNLNRYFLGRPRDAFNVMRTLGLGISNTDLEKIQASDESSLSRHNRSFAQDLAGRILLQVEQNGEAWYVNPIDFKRYYLGRPADAFRIMQELGLGISNENLNKIPVK